MSLHIEQQVFTDLTRDEEKSLKWLERALIKAAEVENERNVAISIQIVDDATIQQLNWEYRQIDAPTDVLSFPQWEEDEERITIPNEPTPLGDIVISLPRAKQQAADYGHSLERELGFLGVHGFLHLLGYDHQTPVEEKKMFTRQEEILQQIGLQR